MIQVKDIDIEGLQRMLGGLQNAFIGVGRDGDAANITKDQARLLAVEIGKNLPPGTKEIGRKKVERDVRNFLTAPLDNITGSRGGDPFVWIHAGPGFLTGARPRDDLRGSGAAEALAALRLEEKQPRGERYTVLGVRGAQQVRIVNRPVVSLAVQASLVDLLGGRIGRLKATLYETAHQLGHKRIPSWIREHFPTKGRVFKDGLSDRSSPHVEFGSSAPGAGPNKKVFARSVKNRVHKVRAQINNVLFGYARDHNARRRITKKFKPAKDE